MMRLFALLALSAVALSSPLTPAVEEFAISNVSAYCRSNNGGC